MGYKEQKQRQFDIRYLQMARVWAENSYCVRRKVGALLVKDKMIISDGYNGTPAGFENICEDDMGKTKPYVLHAEANAITKVAKSENNCDGSTLYVTASPCIECAKLIIQAGIKRVVYALAHQIFVFPVRHIAGNDLAGGVKINIVFSAGIFNTVQHFQIKKFAAYTVSPPDLFPRRFLSQKYQLVEFIFQQMGGGKKSGFAQIKQYLICSGKLHLSGIHLDKDDLAESIAHGVECFVRKMCIAADD